MATALAQPSASPHIQTQASAQLALLSPSHNKYTKK